MIFGIKTNSDPIVNTFMSETDKRINNINDYLKNPFYGKIKQLNDYVAVVDIAPIYPPFFLAGLFPIMVTFVYWIKPLFIGGLIIFSLGLFWNKYFYFFMLMLGLKKAGYKGKIKLISNNQLLKVLINA